jgi:probable F420-dependent oxidoreductase
VLDERIVQHKLSYAEDGMKIGFSLPQTGGQARQATEIARYARSAEALGAASLWVIDRLLAPTDPEVGYAGGDTFPEEFHELLDPFVVMGVAAAATERVSIGSNVLVAPMYPPAVLARSLLTIDQVSGGRFIPGLAAGWSPDEFKAVNVPFTERGKRLDETLDVLDQLWTADPAEYHGTYWQVPRTHASLKPVRRLPVYLGGGTSAAAIRRIATRADGFMPGVVLPFATDLDSLVNQPLARIREVAKEHGRDASGMDVILRIYPMQADDVTDKVIDMIRRTAEETDVDHVLVDLMYQVSDVDGALKRVEAVLAGVGDL